MFGKFAQYRCDPCQTTLNALATSTFPIRLSCAAQAVARGKWLVIEDVNLAPPDVLAALVPLLESRELHLSQRAQTIPAATGFQLLATVTCSPGWFARPLCVLFCLYWLAVWFTLDVLLPLAQQTCPRSTPPKRTFYPQMVLGTPEQWPSVCRRRGHGCLR